MSARKRRVARRITMLVRILETAALMQRQWSRRDTMQARMNHQFAKAIALGKHLSRKGHEARSRAALDASRRASSIIRSEQ